jgi:cyclopropane fatty-acyl-phospholipid synthase-like methyltransferase
MKEFWNERYANEKYAYGEEPNAYLMDKLRELNTGKALFPAEGEGRNSVYAATLGWDVYAFDISEEGKKKAAQLAARRGVHIHYDVTGLEEVNYQLASFDAVILVFAHFPAAMRQGYHHILSGFLKPGGHIIMESFSKDHLALSNVNEKAGGPRDESMLYTTDIIRADFPDMDPLELYQTETHLNEGEFHVGKASVVRFFGKKK